MIIKKPEPVEFSEINMDRIKNHCQEIINKLYNQGETEMETLEHALRVVVLQEFMGHNIYNTHMNNSISSKLIEPEQDLFK